GKPATDGLAPAASIVRAAARGAGQAHRRAGLAASRSPARYGRDRARFPPAAGRVRPAHRIAIQHHVARIAAVSAAAVAARLLGLPRRPRWRRAAFHAGFRTRTRHTHRNLRRSAGAGTRPGIAVRDRTRAARSHPPARTRVRVAPDLRRTAAVHARTARPFRYPPAAGRQLGSPARTPARAAGRTRRAGTGAASRSPAGTRVAHPCRCRRFARHQHFPRRERAAAAAPHLAADAAHSLARKRRTHHRRTRAARKRLVGRRRHAPRLLRHRNRFAPMRMGLPSRGGRGSLHAAGMVCVKAGNRESGIGGGGAFTPFRRKGIAGPAYGRPGGGMPAAAKPKSHFPRGASRSLAFAPPFGTKGEEAYAELHCLSAFSFQRGASVAHELFERAAQLKYTALAITDEASLAGIVRALEASRKSKLRLIVGSEVQLAEGPKLVLLVENARGYTRLCQLLTLARRRAGKGAYRLLREDLAAASNEGLLALWLPPTTPDAADGAWTMRMFPDRAWLAVELHRGPDDAARLAQLRAIGTELDMPLVASGDVHMHVRSRRALQDTLTAIRHKTTVDEAGFKLFPNGERHLRTRRALAAIYPAGLLEETVRIAARCTFSLEELRYEYPHELVPQGHTAASWLRALTEAGARTRWPEGVPDKARALIEHELALISEKQYESYFLTVHDLVRFARSEKILCQGRGSAANSAVCYALGVTEIDPSRMNVLFERF